MAEFPENKVEILRDYFPDDLFNVIRDVRDEIDRILIGRVDLSIDLNEEAHRVNQARGHLWKFLNHPNFDAVKEEIETVYRDIGNRDFVKARRGINKLKNDNDATIEDLTSVTRNTFALAFTFNDLIHIERKFKHSGPDARELLIPRKLNGYDGPILDDDQIDQILTFQRFFRKNQEYRFRRNLITAECLFNERNFQSAINKYAEILPEKVDIPESIVSRFNSITELANNTEGVLLELANLDDFLSEEFISFSGNNLFADDSFTPPHIIHRHKFAAIRSGYAYLALGDTISRSTRKLTDEEQDRAISAYNNAVAVLSENNVSADNPHHQQIADFAEIQKLKIAAGFNYLGFKENHVPILRKDRLRQLALDRVSAAEDAAKKFEDFTRKANQLDDLSDEYNLEIEVGENSVAIAETRRQNSELQVDLIVENQRALEMAEEAHSLGAFASYVDAIVDWAATQSVPGVASGIVNFMARQNELAHQERVLDLEKGMAGRERKIAGLELENAKFRLDFAKSQRQIVIDRKLNADLYYKLANTFESMAESHLDAAILWAFLYERAVAFKRLKSDLATIQFDYLDDTGTILAAPDVLKLDLADVDGQDVPETKGQFLEERLSLRAAYPIEFREFLQTGRMDFAISLYDLDKLRPGVYERRITQVNVELIGLIPATGFAGRVIHNGSFLLRNKTSTLDSSTTRLIPTDDEVADSFGSLEAGGSSGDAVAGVMPFVLDGDRQELSADSQVSIAPDSQEFALKLFEGYGPAGLWSLEIDNIDLRLISDVILKLNLNIPESSGPLQTRVKELVAAYEQELSGEGNLDRITALSLLQQRRDTFFALGNGPASFDLSEDDFPSGITDLKIKAVIIQAIDFDGNGAEGVTFTLSKETVPFSIERTTLTSGFSEDVQAELSVLEQTERFPVFGTWSLALSDANQFNTIFSDPVQQKVGDIVLFFLYEFKDL